jgi:hypothetical protein
MIHHDAISLGKNLQSNLDLVPDTVKTPSFLPKAPLGLNFRFYRLVFIIVKLPLLA